MAKVSRLAAAAAAVLCTFAAAQSGCYAADVRIYGTVDTGVYYSNPEHANGTLRMAGIGETPVDSAFHIEAREALAGSTYVGVNLGNTFAADTGAMANSGVLFDASRLFVGNDKVEFAVGRIGGFTVATEPYSLYIRLSANMTGMQLAGIAPANITYRPTHPTNAFAFQTKGRGFFVQGIYSNGDYDQGVDEETEFDWSDRMHALQRAAGWDGESLKAGLGYSMEMPKNHKYEARHEPMQSLHFLGSYDFGGPAVAWVLFAGTNVWRLGAADDIGAAVGAMSDGRAAYAWSEEGLDVGALVLSARYPVGRHQFAASMGYMHGKWQGEENARGVDEGSVSQIGVTYRYFLSKRANWYAAASYSNGSRLFKNTARFNQYIATTGLCVNF